MNTQVCLTTATAGWRVAIVRGGKYEVWPIAAWLMTANDEGYWRPRAVIAQGFNYVDLPDHLNVIDGDTNDVFYLAPGVNGDDVDLDGIVQDMAASTP
jgi:hypothetical protein